MPNSLCKCRHGPSRWLSSNPITPSICKLVLGKHTDREISLAMEHFAQVGQCQCGKQVILCKYCPLTGDMLAERAPKHIGQRLPNPITFDNRATRHVVESHSSGVYHRYWKALHDEMLSEEKMLSEGAWRGGGADGMDPLASSPVSSCVTGFGAQDAAQGSSTAIVIGQHKLSSEDMWFHTKAEILRQQNLNTAVDPSWRPFPAAQQHDSLSGSVVVGAAASMRDSGAADNARSLCAQDLEPKTELEETQTVLVGGAAGREGILKSFKVSYACTS
ncbi:hypothetical protein GUITHDRAFT_113357 [Guillardia theta CCMP2712]|uniref:Uncharacterized protein n=1 Tax=Guillardia theta (strain CCMP2712) TaxID=905079 RepID=L1IWF7_GUITC|nr:hypothetical protein GUITHDRAFT_113357 [Guillardia theta CCMP2712]EKX40571.1 hypothetical protein GUITHDRAFT_113357 [Guillardia theta CCMP2712]|eukprot:XP_005827551.1 hypothetical protein GUITHDRAFT_113357 [Guillardia theta CCMP2712]